MRRTFLMLGLAAFAMFAAACGSYANTVEGDVSVPQANGPNPQNLPNANHVPKPSSPSGYAVDVSPITIDEVYLSGAQWVELYNATAGDVDLGGWALVESQHSFTFPYGFHLPADTRVLVRLGESGPDTQVEHFAPSFATLNPDRGSLALVRAGGELMHFVQWGAPNQAFEAAAVQSGLWPSGDFVQSAPHGLSLAFDGSANDSSAWRHDLPSR